MDSISKVSKEELLFGLQFLVNVAQKTDDLINCYRMDYLLPKYPRNNWIAEGLNHLRRSPVEGQSSCLHKIYCRQDACSPILG